MAELDPQQAGAAKGFSRQHQLPLEVKLRDDATLDNFLALPRVEPLLRALRAQLESDGEPIIYLYGPAGSGKTHLLQASCHLSDAGTLYLPLKELAQYPAEDVLQGVEQLDRVCIDDLNVVLGDAQWERALFNLYNNARQRGCRLVVAGDAAPRALTVELDDLRSRLSWGIVYQLVDADDDDKATLLQFRAARRGLSLPAEVANFIVSRAPRETEHLLEVLDKLDNASLSQKRALSIPFVKQTLGW
ncbi:MAG: DnaA regulatory inactivator Hda [Halioglobus sp.]|nr:DnaA regulatory inactivator Hda [Halioglobus sp.]